MLLTGSLPDNGRTLHIPAFVFIHLTNPLILDRVAADSFKQDRRPGFGGVSPRQAFKVFFCRQAHAKRGIKSP
jgi:hypothetical protein